MQSSVPEIKKSFRCCRQLRIRDGRHPEATHYRIVEDGVASRDDVDSAIRLSIGPRLALWGPLLTEDIVVSKKTTAFVLDYLYDKTGREQFRRPPTVTKLVEKGRLGAISGQGLYKFEEDYATIVSSRDNQLKSLLDWLRANDRMAEFKLAEDKS